MIAFTNNVKSYADQSKKVVDALNNALAKIQAMKHPFVTYYADASAGAAIEALNVLDDELKALEDLLNNAAGNETQETALAVTRDQFVDKTVLPTYSGLAGACSEMGKALAKLEYDTTK